MTAALSAVQKALALVQQRSVRVNPQYVFYNSFAGHFSDNPRAIFESLVRDVSLAHVWLLEPDGACPAEAAAVAPRSGSYFRSIGRSAVLVSNAMIPQFRKRPGTLYLQTWHGTPLKRLGWDNPQYGHDVKGLSRAARDYARWDLLVSQNAFSTEVFRRAFRYDGEIIESGYPRNDILSAPNRDDLRVSIRRRLSVKAGQFCVLYAPTYRDGQKDPTGRARFDLALDLRRLHDALGNDVIVLLRLHHWAAAELGPLPTNVINVSSYPDIRDLYLAADMLLTDYSSAMFDFAVTRKPIALFVYDLDTYRDALRGFYFDITEQAPGPLCGTTDEVIEAIAGARAQSEPVAGYEAFRKTYASLDDGRATERVVARLTELRHA